MEYKVCRGCNINKPLTEYHNCKSHSDGKKSDNVKNVEMLLKDSIYKDNKDS